MKVPWFENLELDIGSALVEPLLQPLGRQGRQISEFKVSLVYRGQVELHRETLFQKTKTQVSEMSILFNI